MQVRAEGVKQKGKAGDGAVCPIKIFMTVPAARGTRDKIGREGKGSKIGIDETIETTSVEGDMNIAIEIVSSTMKRG